MFASGLDAETAADLLAGIAVLATPEGRSAAASVRARLGLLGEAAAPAGVALPAEIPAAASPARLVLPSVTGGAR